VPVYSLPLCAVEGEVELSVDEVGVGGVLLLDVESEEFVQFEEGVADGLQDELVLLHVSREEVGEERSVQL
jgi:hypothetical protein